MQAMLHSLRAYGQEHLLRFWPELNDAQRGELRRDIAAVDFEFLVRLRREAAATSVVSRDEDIRPLPGRTWQALELGERAAAANAGMRCLREGKAAACVVAGGQGTRLGLDGPKGTLDIGLPSGKSLFQLQAERLLSLSRRSGRPIPWYVMTSRANHDDTVAFFTTQQFFGIARDLIFFFPQGELPIIDEQGKILLAEKHRLAMGPNGNGGCFTALQQSGALEDMRRRGVEWLFLYGVDNALIRVCDPHLLGFAAASDLPIASKAVAKASAQEPVGVFCLRDGRPAVLEYSEIPPELREARDAQGGLVFRSANIATHLFRTDFLAAQASRPLPFHLARKKISAVDAEGRVQKPDAPNACKFEMFLFDLFPRAPGMALLEVERNEEFAPVKNHSATSETDNPRTARALILGLHRNWAQAAGFRDAELAGWEVEVSPLTSYAGERLTRSAFHRDAERPVLWA